MQPSTALEHILHDAGSVLIGYSGGVDSALVAVVSRSVLGRDAAVPVLGLSPSLSERQRRQAIDIAERFDLGLEMVGTDELADARYRANPSNRCYFCKHTLWRTLTPMARERGLAEVVDGTNADDQQGHRPGAGAATEFEVRSPLREAGMTKAGVRAEARRRGIPIWDAPSSPCLASRIRFGVEVDENALRMVEAGEEFLRTLGITGDFRVRHRGTEARIEVAPDLFDIVRQSASVIAPRFNELGWTSVTLDLGGYRSGSQLAAPTAAEPVRGE